MKKRYLPIIPIIGTMLLITALIQQPQPQSEPKPVLDMTKYEKIAAEIKEKKE